MVTPFMLMIVQLIVILKEWEENLEFIPSDTFRGAIEGYVFKNGDMGIGYYIDNNI